MRADISPPPIQSPSEYLSREYMERQQTDIAAMVGLVEEPLAPTLDHIRGAITNLRGS